MLNTLAIALIGILALAIVITTQMRLFSLKRRLKDAQGQAETARRLKSEFIAKVSHELKTPLNSAVGYVDLLREGKYGLISTEQNDILRRVHDACYRLLTLIQNLLDFSGADLGKIKLNLEEFDLNDELKATVEMIDRHAVQKGVTVSTWFDPQLGRFYSDRQKLRQAITNILVNAVKFTAKGSIEVRTKLFGAGSFALIEVKDTGIGIPAEELPYVFEEFRQADGSIRRDYGGQGLGLSIAQQFVHFLGGEIIIESTQGEGTTVRLAVPKRIEHPMRREVERVPALRALKEIK